MGRDVSLRDMKRIFVMQRPYSRDVSIFVMQRPYGRKTVVGLLLPRIKLRSMLRNESRVTCRVRETTQPTSIAPQIIGGRVYLTLGKSSR